MHLGRALEIELARVHPHPRGVAAEPARVHAEQDVLRLGVFAVHVVAVAGGHGWDAEFAGELQGHIGHLPLHIQAVVLDLDEIPVAEPLLKPAGNIAGLGERLSLFAGAADERPVELARQAARQADDPLAVLLQQVTVDPRLEIEALQVGLGGQLEQVVEARPVAGQQREVVAGVLLVAGILLKPAARGDVGLVADDRVELGGLGGLVELQGTVEIAVVGDRQGVHPEFDGTVHESVDRAGPVEQAVVAVAVEMDERLRAHPCARSNVHRSRGCGIVPDRA